MTCPECNIAAVKEGALFCPSCTGQILEKIVKYRGALNSPDEESVKLGYSTLLEDQYFMEDKWFELFRKRYGCERVFFRQKLSPFEELCQYIETTFLPSKGTSLHIVAQTKMTNIFLTFIQNHLRYGIL